MTAQRGVTLIESMIALVVLSMGILGLAHFQINMVSQSTDAQSRLAATNLTEELLALVQVDRRNAPCYTWPQQGNCTSALAKQQVVDWVAKVQQAGFVTVSLAQPTVTQLTATLTWQSKAFTEQRSHVVTTDVRP